MKFLHTDLLDKAFRSIIRYVYGKGKYDSISTVADRFLGFGLVDHLKFRSMSFMYRLTGSDMPSYLRDLIIRGHSDRTRQLVVPRLNNGKFLFSQGIVDWNALPVVVRNSGTYDLFRRRYMARYVTR